MKLRRDRDYARLVRNAMLMLIGVSALWCVFGPFPGLGLMYPIRDALRGHPYGAHGTQPAKFVGLWIRDEAKEFDFDGQAFYLQPDGRVSGDSGMTFRHWHFDRGVLYVDSWSGCGNCNRGNVTAEYTANFLNPDALEITNRDKAARRGPSGLYRRVEVTDALKLEMTRLSESKNEAESFQGRSVLRLIERYKLQEVAAKP